VKEGKEIPTALGKVTERSTSSTRGKRYS